MADDYTAEFDIQVGFKTGRAAKSLYRDLGQQEARYRSKSLSEQKRALSKKERRQKKVQDELAERRRKLAIESIDDQTKREVKRIEQRYELERENIKKLLKARRRANQITSQEYRDQLDSFDTQLGAVRDRKVGEARGRGLGSKLGASGLLAQAKAYAGPAAAAAAGLAVEEGLRRSIKAAVTFQKQLVAVQKTTGLTDRKLATLGEELLTLSARLGAPQEDLAKIAEVAGQAGVQGVQNITALTEVVAKLSSVSDLSAEEASENLAKISNIFALPIQEAERLGSVLNELSNTTTAKAGDVADALRESGQAGAALGLTVDQVSGVVSTLIDTGLKTETAGTASRNLFVRLRTQAADLAEVVGVTSEEFNAMVSEDALGALRAYLTGLRGIPEAERAIRLKKTFGDENYSAVQALSAQTDLLTKNLDTAGGALEQGASLNREFAASLNSVSAQWNKFTATLTQAATRAGQVLLPTIQSVLESINALSAGAKETGKRVESLSAEFSKLSSTEEAIGTYERLSQKTGRSEEETRALNRATKLLQERYPGYVRETNAAGRAVSFYADALSTAVTQRKALNLAEQGVNIENLLEGFREQRKEATKARDEQQLLNESLNRYRKQLRRAREAEVTRANGKEYIESGPGYVERAEALRLIQSAIAGTSERIGELGEAAKTADRKTSNYTRALASLGITADGFSLDQLVQELLKVEDLTDAEAQRQARRLAEAYYELGQVDAAPTVDLSAVTEQNVEDRIAGTRRELEQLNEELSGADLPEIEGVLSEDFQLPPLQFPDVSFAELTGQSRLDVLQRREEVQANLNALLAEQKRLQSEPPPDPGGDPDGDPGGDPSGLEQARKELDALRSRAGQEQAKQTGEPYRAELDALDELARQYPALEAQIAQVTKRYEALAQAAREKQEAEAQEKRQEAINQAREQAGEQERKIEGLREEAQLRRRLAAIDDPTERRQVQIQATYEQQAEAAREAYEREKALIEQQTENEEVKAAKIAAIQKELDAELLAADQERIQQTDQLEEEAAERQEQRMEERERQVARYTDALVDSAFAAFQGQQDLTDAQVELRRLQFSEEEEALRESLQSQEITRREFNLRMQRLSERRAQLEKDVERGRADFVQKSARAVRDVVVGAVKDRVKKVIAEKTAELLFHQGAEAAKTGAEVAGAATRSGAEVAASATTQAAKSAEAGTHTAAEAEKTAASTAGTATRTAQNAAESTSSLASAGAAIVEAIAQGVSAVAAASGPFAVVTVPLALGALTAALYAGFQGTKSLFGFQSGGYTGGGREDEVAGVVHGGEVVMEAPIVEGQEREWLAIRQAAQRGVPVRAMAAAAAGGRGYQGGGLVESPGLSEIAVPVYPPAPEGAGRASAADLADLRAGLDTVARQVSRVEAAVSRQDRNQEERAGRPTRLASPRRTSRRLSEQAAEYDRLKNPRGR